MIPLDFRGKPKNVQASIIGRVTSKWRQPLADHVLLVRQNAPAQDVEGYAAVLTESPASAMADAVLPVVSDLDLSRIADEDVVRIDSRGHVRLLYRRQSAHNFLFATDRCNSLCLMCSQPPREVDDRGQVQELFRTVRLISPETQELGITGGEPTLLKDGFLEVVKACRDHLPRTALHVLSNGRLFYHGSFARALADISHPDIMVGVPLYADNAVAHDHVVQARGAFDETVVGLQNLGRFGVPVEIRVVLHALTWRRLPELAEFIYRNFTFASHVALMGLEQIGFAITNRNTLWIDPIDYSAELQAATLFLADRGMTVSIYNHQLCTVPQPLWQFCRKSISDWKNEYLPVCAACGVRERCGGFFASVIKRRISRSVSAVANPAM